MARSKYGVWDYVQNRVIKRFAKEADAKEFIRRKLRTVGGAYHLLKGRREVDAFIKAGPQTICLSAALEH